MQTSRNAIRHLKKATKILYIIHNLKKTQVIIYFLLNLNTIFNTYLCQLIKMYIVYIIYIPTYVSTQD